MKRQTLSNEYAELLSYLERHGSAAPRIERQKIVPVKKQSLETKREEVSKQTKKLIEECQTDYIADIPRSNTESSNGFDVGKLEDLMRARLVDEHKRLQSYERPYISVSELYSCMRKNYYNRLKYPIDVKEQYRFAYLYLINQIGDKVHDVIQSIYDFSEVEKTVVSEKFKVKGRVDALRERILYELKTIDPEKFKNAYIKEHYFQGLVYAHILNTEYNYNIETISIVYIIRTLKRVKPFDLPYKPELADSLLRHAITLRSCITEKTVPDPIRATDEQCKFCQYKGYCEKDACKKILQPFADKDDKVKDKKEAVFLL